MEDDKKKRKNKKKKNKQQAKAASEDTASNAGETSSVEHNNVSEQQNNHMNGSVESNGAIGDNGSNKIVENKGGGGGHNAEGANGSISGDIEKKNWLQEEARLREMVKQLLYEKNSYIQSQADLEMKIKQLQCDNDSFHDKEVSMKQRISQLLQEKTSLSLEERNLQEKARHAEKERALLVEKENSSKEVIETLNNENTRLQMQVVELEGVKNNLVQENKQLLDNISMLQSQVQDLERSLANSSVDAQKDNSEKDDLNAQMDAACALVEKLVTENAELVEKINELYMELGSQSVTPESTSVAIPDYDTVRDPVSSGDISSSAKSVKLFETVPIEGERVVSDDVDTDYANIARHSSETAVSGEIVQIPLDENDLQDLEAHTSITEGNDSVPLADAPLIGAPFRLISFVAKYVSGADLVNSATESQQ